MRVLVGTDTAVQSPMFVGSDGETPTATTGTPTVTVTRANGTVVSAPTVTSTATTGVYTATLTATVTATLDVLTVVWTGTADSLVQRYSQTVEVVGGYYATIPEIRALPGMANQVTYPTSALIETREEFERLAEDYLGVAWVPRYEYETIRGAYGYGCGTQVMLRRLRPRTIRYVTFAGTVITDTSLMHFTIGGALDWSYATYAAPLTLGQPGDIVIGYEHGYDTPPEQLRRACREYVRSRLLKSTSGVSRDVISEAMGDGGSTRYSTPDRANNRPTGYIDVDLLLNSVGRDRPSGTA